MAKKSWFAREAKRRAMYEKYKDKRAQLKKEGDWFALARLPRNSSPCRLNNRCSLTGRSRGYYRRFGISRVALRELALLGQIPGMTKASW